MTRHASCCCGDVHIKVDGDPHLNAVCHCENCRKRTGSAFGWSTYFSPSQVVEKSGGMKCYRITGSNAHDRYFCPSCGSTVYWIGAHPEGMIGIAGGCFGPETLPEPDLSVSCAEKMDWVVVPEKWQQRF